MPLTVSAIRGIRVILPTRRASWSLSGKLMKAQSWPFCGFADTLNSHFILGQVDTRLILEGVDDVFNQDDIKVLATEVGISICRLDLENALLHLQDGIVECAHH